jgi:hypothetical protein
MSYREFAAHRTGERCKRGYPITELRGELDGLQSDGPSRVGVVRICCGECDNEAVGEAPA